MKKNLSLSSSFVLWAPPVVWAGAIFFLSSQPVLPSLDLSYADFFFKKSAHMAAYAGLYYLVRKAIWGSFPTLSKYDWRVWLLPLLICIIYAFTDEFHQSFTPNRTASLRDVGYDFLGMSFVFLRQYRFI